MRPRPLTTVTGDSFSRWLSDGDLAAKASYTVPEVARLLSVSRRTVYRMIARGDLTAFHVSYRRDAGYRIPRSELESIHRSGWV